MEFMIKTKDGDWFQFPEGMGCEIFLPNGLEANLGCGSEVCEINHKGCVFSFSVEEPGIQVVLESGEISEQDANEFVAAVVHTFESFTKQKCEYVHYA